MNRRWSDRNANLLAPGTKGFLLFLLLLLIASPARAAELEGHWEGTIQVPGQTLDLDLDFSSDGGQWSGDISIPAQGARDLPLEAITVKGETVSFAITGIPGAPTFEGAFREDGKEISGEFRQGGQSFPFTLTSGVSPAIKARNALTGLDEVLNAALRDWQTPGLALGVVMDGQVVMAQGFGVRDLDSNAPVDAGTLFAIGSCTKAFTTFLLGTLVDEGKLDWDAPLRTYLPEFSLANEYASEHVDTRDMVSHRTGLPRHDLLWYNNDSITREEMMLRLRYLEANAELREQWQYNNLMYCAAGYLAERMLGQSWEEAVRERIFDPLGMTRTNFSVRDTQVDANFASPYVLEDEKLRKVAFRNLDVIGPAGSINSCVDDMNRWVRLHLDNGSFEDASLLSPGTMQILHTPIMPIGGLPTERFSGPLSYAMGWMVDTWHGHLRVFHGGNIDGFSALVTLFPKDGLGVVALSNRNGDALPALATAEVADRILELDISEDRFAKAATQRTEMQEFVKQGEANREMFRKKNTKPSHPLRELAGDYAHDGYGPLEVMNKNGKLSMVYNGMTMPLEHWHFDEFTVADVDDELIPENIHITFRTGSTGEVDGLFAGFEPSVEPIFFARQPDRKLRDPEYLARMVGTYALPGETYLEISLKGAVLTGQITGQPSFELKPSGSDEFRIAQATDVVLRFRIPDAGPAEAVILSQGGGVYVLERAKKR